MMKRLVCGVALLVAAARPAFAQSRPLMTEDPEVLTPGQMAVSVGVDYQHGLFYPASGLTGNTWRVGTFGFDFGVSSIAEIQVSGGVQDVMSVTNRVPAPLSYQLTFNGNTTHDYPDAIIGAKIRLIQESSHPSLAIRFSTRLPNEGNESGLGLDTTDFNFNFLVGKTVESVRFVGNVGFGILGDPVDGNIQNDVLNYGFSAARAVRQGVELVGEINGRLNTRNGTPPPGTESRSVVRLGGRITKGSVRMDAALLLGVTSFDPSWGFSTGLTWVFHAFDVK